MEGISFEEETERLRIPAARTVSGMAAFMISLGFAKDERGATTILIAIAIIATIGGISIFLFSRPKESSLPAPAVPMPVPAYAPAR